MDIVTVHTNAWQTPGTNKVDLDIVAFKIAHNAQHCTSNYWSPLACLVEEQEEQAQEHQTKGETAGVTITDGQPTNKVAAYWARKLTNRKARQYAFLDSGSTSGAALEENEQDLNNTGKMFRKTFMFPNRRTGKATKKMLLKHNLCIAAWEMNMMPGLHLALVSVPKLADTGYTTVLPKDGAIIYNVNPTAITASNPPILESNRCQHTGMWRLNLNPKNPNTHSPDKQHVIPETINVIFDLPSSCKTFFLVPRISRIPTKRNTHQCHPQQKLGNMAKTNGDAYQPIIPWLGRDSERTPKGPTTRHPFNKTKSIGKIIENEIVRIKIKGKNHLSTTSQSPKPTKLSSALRTYPTWFTPTNQGPSHSLPNKAADTSWWQSTSTQTTSLSNLCIAGQRKRWCWHTRK